MALWDHSLAVGIPEVDKSHESTLAQMEEVLEAIAEEDVGRTELLLRELAGDVSRHFETEESLAPADSFTREHLDSHRLFVAELERLRDAFGRRGLAPALPLWIRSRIVNWFKIHIGTHDAALAEAISRASPACQGPPPQPPSAA
jgi:hemerythrin-like metal-binding protein